MGMQSYSILNWFAKLAPGPAPCCRSLMQASATILDAIGCFRASGRHDWVVQSLTVTSPHQAQPSSWEMLDRVMCSHRTATIMVRSLDRRSSPVLRS